MIDLDRRMLLVEFFDQRQRIFRRGARIPDEPAFFFRPFDQLGLPLRRRQFVERREGDFAILRPSPTFSTRIEIKFY